jgi:DtxR family Mn-dependent transcriptional regulator
MSMRLDLATENYLKAIVKALAEPGKERIGTGEIARLVGVTPGTATVMVKKLEREGYVAYESHRGCALTGKGRTYGLRVLRRHRLLETFLARVLDLDWADIHEEAENLEHAVSERLIDAIDAYLGHPVRDPQGDPIPEKAQREYTIRDVPLSTLAEGERVQIVRIDGDKGALAYYRSEGLVPGTELRVVAKREDAGLVTLSLPGREATFALSALEGVFAESGAALKWD